MPHAEKRDTQRKHTVHLFDCLLYQLYVLSFLLSPSLFILAVRCVLQFHCTRPRSFDGTLGLRAFFILNVVFNVPPIWQHARHGALGEADGSLLDFVGPDHTPSKSRLLALDWFIQALQLVCIVFAYQSSTTQSTSILPVHSTLPEESLKTDGTDIPAAREADDLIMDITLSDIIRQFRSRTPSPLTQDFASSSRGSLLPVRDPMTFLLRGRAGSLGESMAASRRLAQGGTRGGREETEGVEGGDGVGDERIPGGLS